jgi:proteic killer suppression protein
MKHCHFMIASFGDRRSEDLFHGRRTDRARRLPPDIVSVVRRKLDMIQAARTLNDLRSPPSNRLEALKRELKGFYGIRVNDQWRIVFRWSAGDAFDVRIVDYH